MTKLPYVRTMFATGMLFQVIYVACVLLWFIDPQSERALVAAIDFSELYAADNWKLHLWPDRERPEGWIAAITFVFFYNLWPGLALALFGRRAVVNRN